MFLDGFNYSGIGYFVFLMIKILKVYALLTKAVLNNLCPLLNTTDENFRPCTVTQRQKTNKILFALCSI